MIDIVMPQMGESIVEGTLTKWLKKQGEHVERDEPLFEISTDKVDTEIPSPAAGVLSEVLVAEGKTVAISTVVGKIDEAGGNGAVAKPAAAVAAPAPKAPEAPAPVPAAPVPQPAAAEIESLNGPLSPLVRKMAREYNIDLKQVKGTGAGGRITKQDLESYMSAQGARTMAQATPPPPAAAAPAASAPAPAPTPAAQPAAPAPTPAPASAHRARVEPMSAM